MANVSVTNTTAQLSGNTIAVCENDQTISGAWTFTGNQTFQGNITLGNAVGDTITVTGTITSNLIFTDATYDIGASGATRPRDFFLSRNATVGGTLAVTGVATLGGTSAGELRLLEPSGGGSSYIALLSPALAGTVSYTLPTADGSSGQVLSTNGSGTLSWGTRIQSFDRDVAVASVTNTVTETTVYTTTVAANTLSTNRMLRITALADYLNNDGAARTLTIRIKYGTTTYATYALSLGNSATIRPVMIDSALSALNATNAQVGGARFWVENAVGVAGNAGASLANGNGSMHAAVAEDSTGALALAITVQHDTASSNITFRMHAVQVELI